MNNSDFSWAEMDALVYDFFRDLHKPVNPGTAQQQPLPTAAVPGSTEEEN